MQIEPQQAHAPKASATVDIVQFADGSLELRWRGHVLKHRAYGLHAHLGRSKVADDKTINTQVDALRHKEQRRLTRLRAEVEHHNEQRRAGVCTSESSVSTPAVAAVPP